MFGFIGWYEANGVDCLPLLRHSTVKAEQNEV